MAGVRLAVLDDGQFVRTYAGTVHPVAATFHRFVEAVAASGRFAAVSYVVPVRGLRIWEDDPRLPPVDERLVDIVPTAPFAGIADYLLRSGYLAARNWPRISEAVAEADLLWLRLPASNALLALAAARRAAVPHFGWLAGSVAGVARAQSRPAPMGWLAAAVGLGYDAVSDLAAQLGPQVELDVELFSSVITADEVSATRAGPPLSDGPPWRLAWAGRMAPEKGLDVLVEAVALLRDRGCAVTLHMIGDGPERGPVEQHVARALPRGSVTWAGFVGDRAAYLQLLREAHLLVHPSAAEGMPKILVEAMAAGVPIVAADAGAVRSVLADGRGLVVQPDDTHALADAVERLLADQPTRAAQREAGLAFAGRHTADDQARRLVEWLERRFPGLDWAGLR